MGKKVGTATVLLESSVGIVSSAAVVGQKEFEGPLGKFFDKVCFDETLGQKTFEQAESKMQQTALKTALKKCNKTNKDIDYILAGDLLNQCIASSYGLREEKIQFLGLYGACSTMALSMALGSVLIDSGAANTTVAVTSSHFCGSERQYRFPLEYGNQRTPTAQWTVTGSGAAVLQKNGIGPKIKQITFGKIVDKGITDANNMGAAMAPAAADTVTAFLRDTNTVPSNYDLILTGDLGKVGSDLFTELMSRENYDVLPVHNDCGKMIFDFKNQDVHSGGSGCGCCASVFCSYIMNKLNKKELKNILFCATGALMSPTASMQGETVPAIAHLLNITT